MNYRMTGVLCVVLCIVAAGAHGQPFVGTVEDTYQSNLRVEIESPLREGAWLVASEASASGSRTTRVAAAEGARELAVDTDRWGNTDAPPASSSFRIADVPEVAEASQLGSERLRVAAVDRRAAGGPWCGGQPAPGATCREMDLLLPLPPLAWQVTAVDGRTLNLRADGVAQALGLPIETVMATVQLGDSAIEWTVSGEGVEAARPVPITDAQGKVSSSAVPTRFVIELKGSSVLRSAQ